MNTQQKLDFTPHPNSLEVYKDNILPNITERENQCLNALRYLGEATASEVATHLKMFHHQISGRFTRLKEKGMVKIVGIKRIGTRPNDILQIV